MANEDDETTTDSESESSDEMEMTPTPDNRISLSIAVIKTLDEVYIQGLPGGSNEEIDSKINKCFICLDLCIFVDRHDVNNVLKQEEIEKWSCRLLKEFDFHNNWSIWSSLGLHTRAALVYGLVLLLYSSHELIRNAVYGSLKNIIWNEMDKDMTNSSLLYFFQDFTATGKMFASYIQLRDKPKLTLRCMISGVNLLLELLQDNEDRIKSTAWDMLSCLIMHVDGLNLLHYIVNDGLHSIGGQQDLAGDYLFDKLGFVIRQKFDSTVTEDDVQIAERRALLCFAGYSNQKKQFVCSVLLGLPQSDKAQSDNARSETRLLQLVKNLILAIEIQERGAQIWGETTTLMDRLIFLFKRNRNYKRKQLMLGIIHMLVYKMETVVMSSSLEDFVYDLINWFTTSSEGLEVQELSGKCLLIFLQHEFYSMNCKVYLHARDMLASAEIPRDLQRLTDQISAVVEAYIDKLLRRDNFNL